MSKDKKVVTKLPVPEPPAGLLERPVLIPENGMQVLERRYLRKGEDGKPMENVPQMIWRVASYIAADCATLPTGQTVQQVATKYYDLIAQMLFFPNSPTFTGAGTPLGQLAACFVLAIADDMGKDEDAGIFSTLRHAALIQQTGGGIGFSFSRLRPKGDRVRTSGGSASGPLSFLKVFDAAFGAIAQGGTRRGANMGVMRVDHPDIEEFIEIKAKEGTLTNFNLSVGLTDEFMTAVRESSDYQLVNPRTKQVTSKISAKRVFDKIVAAAHHNGEPGVLFLDTANKANPVPHLYTLEATNPCGEQWLGPFENCCLGSLNLSRFFKEDSRGVSVVDWDALAVAVQTSTRFLDDVIDANKYVPVVPQLREAAQRCRRIGLGIMGLADLCYAVRVRYGSRAMLDLSGQVMEFVRYHSMMTSIKLSQERGPFPGIKGSIYDPEKLVWQPPTPLQAFEHEFGRPELDWTDVLEGIRKHGLRNAAQTTVAPTGTIGTVTGCEGYGCEPVFALAYVRHVKEATGDVDLTYVSPHFTAMLDSLHLTVDARQRVISQVVNEGTCQACLDLPEDIRNVFVVSSDVSVREHVLVQASLQRFVDNSISKTVNFPAGATQDDVREAYLSAWTLGCKGLTVYVTGSRSNVVLETKVTAKADEKKQQEAAAAAAAGSSLSAIPQAPSTISVLVAPPPPLPPSTTASPIRPAVPPLRQQAAAAMAEAAASPDTASTDDEAPVETMPVTPFLKKRPRPAFLQGTTYRAETPLGEAYVTVNNTEDGEPFEVFLNVGKGGSDVSAVSEALGRLVSMNLRMPSLMTPTERLTHMVGQLEGIGGRKVKRMGKERITSMPDSIARVLKTHVEKFCGIRGRARLSQTADLEESFNAAAAGAPSASNLSGIFAPQAIGDLCPDCGNSTLLNIEGCRKCHVCGYSEC